jgi:hypothetical protein
VLGNGAGAWFDGPRDAEALALFRQVIGTLVRLMGTPPTWHGE